MLDNEKLAFLQGFLLGMARRLETLPMLAGKFSADPGSAVISDVCASAAKDCVAAANLAGIADISDDGQACEPGE